MEADRASRALTKSSTAGNSFVLEAQGALVALLETKLTSTALHFSVLSPSVLKYLPALYPRGSCLSAVPSPQHPERRVCAGQGKENEPLLSALCPGTRLAQSGPSGPDSSHLLLQGEHASRDFSPPPRSFGSSPYFPSRLTCTSTAILGQSKIRPSLSPPLRGRVQRNPSATRLFPVRVLFPLCILLVIPEAGN